MMVLLHFFIKRHVDDSARGVVGIKTIARIVIDLVGGLLLQPVRRPHCVGPVDDLAAVAPMAVGMLGAGQKANAHHVLTSARDAASSARCGRHPPAHGRRCGTQEGNEPDEPCEPATSCLVSSFFSELLKARAASNTLCRSLNSCSVSDIVPSGRSKAWLALVSNAGMA